MSSMLRWVLLVLALVVPRLAVADSSGVDSRPTFPPLGCGSAATGEEAGCHFQDANPAVMVTIEGPSNIAVGGDVLGFGVYTASMPPDTLGLEGAGINATIDLPNEPGCEIDTFSPVDKMKLINDKDHPSAYPLVSHRDDGEPPPQSLFGVWSYQFVVFNCKMPGPLLLRVAMNAFDGSGDESGEAWNTTTKDVSVPEPGVALAGAAAAGALAALRHRRS
jgi:hypothetical protein